MRFPRPLSFLALAALAALAAGSRLGAAEPFVPAAPMIRVWPGVAPGSEGQTAPERWIEGGAPDAFHRVTDIHVPSLTIYLPPPDQATGAAVIIAPGGGHRYLVVDLEGEFVAQKLNAMGVAAFVLRSRLARAEKSTYTVEGESLADLQQAIRLVRGRAAEWHVNPARVGVMGFSAGGHLAALAENKSDAATRPDFAVLGYPALSAGYGAPAVAADAPPTFIYVNDDDPFATSAGEYYLALRQAKIPAEFHVFRRGATAPAPPGAARTRASTNSAPPSGPGCSGSGWAISGCCAEQPAEPTREGSDRPGWRRKLTSGR